MEGLIWAIAILLAVIILLASAWSLFSSVRDLARKLSKFKRLLGETVSGNRQTELPNQHSQINDDPAKHLLARRRFLRNKRHADELRTRRLIKRLKSR